MHDPLVVAFEIRRPWPKRSSLPDPPAGVRWRIRWGSSWTLAGRRYWFPPIVTVWHVEPGGRDSGEVCKHYCRYEQADSTWATKVLNGWRFHIWHWRIQVQALQMLRRRLLTRCEWCGGKGSPNVSHQWNRDRSPWWRGEPGLYHPGCSTASTAWKACVCDEPVTEHDGWGNCARCGDFRGFNTQEWQRQLYIAIRRKAPRGSRISDARVREVADIAKVEYG